MIAKRIRRGRRAARGSVKRLHRFITALTRYLVNAQAEDLVAIETGRRLTDYILDAKGGVGLETLGVKLGEKVVYSDARNLIGDGLESWQAQMLATAARVTRCRDPIEHYVLSWQTGEKPTEQQFGRAVEIAVAELGLSECQAVWAVHGNTDNLHVHIAVNRVHPVTFKTLSAGDGWDKDRLQQICTLIEDDGGWRAEKNAHYVMRGCEVVHRETDTVVRDRDGRQTRARDRASEAVTIPEQFGPVAEAIAAASDWRDLHDRMHALGARYERAGPGANVVCGDMRIKASKLGRDCSLPALEKRLGAFEPSHHLDGYARYKAQRNAERDKLKSAKSAAIALVEGWYSAQSSGLAAHAGSEIIALLLADLGARKTAILASIDAAFSNAEAAIGAIGSERAWIAAGKPDHPGVVAAPVVLLPSLVSQSRNADRSAEVMATYSRSENTRTGLIEYRDQDGKLVMVDAAGVIVVYKRARAEIEAGLLLAAGRWSEVKFTGDATASEIVVELARLHKIRVVNADGRPIVARPFKASPAPSADIDRAITKAGLPSDQVDAERLPSGMANAADREATAESEPAISPPVDLHSPPEDEGPDLIGHMHQQRGRGREL